MINSPKKDTRLVRSFSNRILIQRRQLLPHNARIYLLKKMIQGSKIIKASEQDMTTAALYFIETNYSAYTAQQRVSYNHPAKTPPPQREAQPHPVSQGTAGSEAQSYSKT